MHLPSDFYLGLVVVFCLTGLSILSKKIDLPGAGVGFLLTLSMFLGASWYGIVLLTGFFALGTMVSMWRRKEKKALQLEQEKGGKRGIVHALANGGVAGACGLVAWIWPEYAFQATLAMSASIASATSDTFSSELGNVYGSRYWDILSWRKGNKGADGIISLEGSLAGLLGAALIAALFWAFFPEKTATVWLILLAGIFGNLMDSVLGASLQRKGLLDNHSVNFFNTLAAAIMSLLLFA